MYKINGNVMIDSSCNTSFICYNDTDYEMI